MSIDERVRDRKKEECERVFEWIENHHRLAQTSAAVVLVIKVQSLILFFYKPIVSF